MLRRGRLVIPLSGTNRWGIAYVACPACDAVWWHQGSEDLRYIVDMFVDHYDHTHTETENKP